LRPGQGQLAIALNGDKKLSFDPAKDFAPVTLTARFLTVLVTNPNKLKVNSVPELIDQAKREPGKIDIAHAGVGNPLPSRRRAVPAGGRHQA
jgi:tripartite-type tricarboxylate transporter receptor subunit TctC